MPLTAMSGPKVYVLRIQPMAQLVLCFINNVTISEIRAIVGSYVGSCQTFAS